MAIRIGRIYDPPDGGTRILVDRLWPRGVSKQRAALATWSKGLAPSDALRKEFHAGMPWAAFETAYRHELEGADLAPLRGDDVVLLTASRSDPCHAHVLAAVATGDVGKHHTQAGPGR
jgi:uncharacterized protein YeaO (DUF488 family)